MVAHIIEYKNDVPCLYAPSQQALCAWFEHNGAEGKSIWLIIYHKKAATPSVNYDQAVDEALCVGWIDSLLNKRNAESYNLRLTPRKPKSNWSLVNKDKVEQLTKAGLMTEPGLKMVELAKATNRSHTLKADKPNRLAGTSKQTGKPIPYSNQG